MTERETNLGQRRPDIEQEHPQDSQRQHASEAILSEQVLTPRLSEPTTNHLSVDSQVLERTTEGDDSFDYDVRSIRSVRSSPEVSLNKQSFIEPVCDSTGSEFHNLLSGANAEDENESRVQKEELAYPSRSGQQTHQRHASIMGGGLSRGRRSSRRNKIRFDVDDRDYEYGSPAELGYKGYKSDHDAYSRSSTSDYVSTTKKSSIKKYTKVKSAIKSIKAVKHHLSGPVGQDTASTREEQQRESRQAGERGHEVPPEEAGSVNSVESFSATEPFQDDRIALEQTGKEEDHHTVQAQETGQARRSLSVPFSSVEIEDSEVESEPDEQEESFRRADRRRLSFNSGRRSRVDDLNEPELVALEQQQEEEEEVRAFSEAEEEEDDTELANGVTTYVDNGNAEVMSTRSRCSSVSGVKWKAVLDEVAGPPMSEEEESVEEGSKESKKSALDRLVAMISEELNDFEESPLKTSAHGSSFEIETFLQTVKATADDALNELAKRKRKHKNEVLKLRAQIERLNEKVEVNIHLDSRIQEQNKRMKELEAENKSLKALCHQSKFNETASIDLHAQENERLEMLEAENEELLRNNQSLSRQVRMVRKKYEELTLAQEESTMAPRRMGPGNIALTVSSEVGIVSPQSRQHSLGSEFGVESTSHLSSSLIDVLKENNSNLLKTNDHLIKTNEALLKTNKSLSDEFTEAKARFQREQEQWRRNWEMLKMHYEMRATDILHNGHT